MRHLDHDRLVQLGAASTERDALGPRTSAETAHLGTCADCRGSLEEIRRTFALAGVETTPDLDDPSSDVWRRINAAVGAESPGVGAAGARVTRLVAAAAAGVGLLVGVGAAAIVVSAGSDEPVAVEPAKPDIVATAALSVLTGSGDASGTARLIQEDGRWVLQVDTRGLVPRGGYFEVWLLDATGRMYALGALPEGSTACLAVPEGISIAQFNIVDISVQQFNGDPRHSSDSVLRGILRG